jgi:hypothetical protein
MPEFLLFFGCMDTPDLTLTSAPGVFRPVRTANMRVQRDHILDPRREVPCGTCAVPAA